MKRVLFLSLLVMLFGSFHAVAAEKHAIDVWFEKALEAEPSTAGMRQSIAEATTRWDAELNRLYRALAKRLRPPAMALLRAAQQKWIAYRDAEILAAAAMLGQVYEEAGGGTMWALMEQDRVMQITRNRALELAGYLANLAQVRQ